jgi:O-antigen/teichoic acid export membrane protein
MTTAGNLVRGSAFRTLELLGLLAATFWTAPLLVSALGERHYAFWTLALACVGYYGLLDLGMTSAAARFLSRALGRGDAAALETAASTALALFCAVAAGVAAATAAVALSCRFFLHDPAEAALFREAVLLLGAAAALGVPSKVHQGLLTAGLRHDAVALIGLGRTLCFAAAVCLTLRAGGGLVGVAAAAAAVNLAQAAALWLAARSLYPALRPDPRRFDRGSAREMLSYGSKTFVVQVGDLLCFRIAPFVVAAFLGAARVTPYSLGARLVEAFCQLVVASFGMMMPVFSRYEGAGDYPAMRAALLRVTKLSAVVSGFAGLSTAFYARPFLERWMGPNFDSASAAGVAAVLAGGYVLALPQASGTQLLFGLSKHKAYAALNLGEGLLNLALSALLARRLGLLGVALGTALATIAVKCVVQPVYVCRAVGLPLRDYLGDAIVLTLVKTAAPLALYFYAARGFVSADYASLAACAAVQTVLFVPVAGFLVLTREERGAVAGALRAASRRPAAPALEAAK